MYTDVNMSTRNAEAVEVKELQSNMIKGDTKNGK